MCSTQCEMPVIPGTSLRAPTRYQTQKVATGAACSSRVSTVSPLGSVAVRVGDGVRTSLTAISSAVREPGPVQAAANGARRLRRGDIVAHRVPGTCYRATILPPGRRGSAALPHRPRVTDADLAFGRWQR